MIRFRPYAAALLLAASASTAFGDTQFAIGEPAEGKVYSGIGQISGFAVSDEKIVSVEAFIDGISLGLVPYGGTRKDVASAFPEYPDSEFSGWAMKWNYAILEEGEHLLTIVVTEEDGDQLSKDVTFSVTGFKSEFISDPQGVDISGATIDICDAMRVCITGAMIEGEEVDIEMSWNKASQQFQIDSITYAGDVPANNLAPEAWAGLDVSAEAGSMVSLGGSGVDADGTIESHNWQQISGPEISLDDPLSWNVQFSAPLTEGEIRLRLTVTDDQGATDSDDVIVTVTAPDPDPEPNQPPSAFAGADQIVLQGEDVVVSGNGSDPDGSIVDWTWSQVSGPLVSLINAGSPQVSFTAPGSPGDVRLRLTVTDDDGATDSDEVVITVEAPPPEPNQPPTANAGADRTADQGSNVVVTGSGSDVDGTIVAWAWAQVSGASVSLSNANQPQVSFTAPGSPGNVVLRLTVTDDDGAMDSDDVVITVEAPPPEPNQPPTADAGSNRTVDQGANVVVTGSGSDSDGTIVDWAWSQVSGTSVSLSNANQPQVSFTAPGSPGNVVLRLTVTDDDGATDSDDVVITVQAPPEPDGTTGGFHQGMLDIIHSRRAQPQTCGETDFPAVTTPLAWSQSLANIAEIHSMDMARQGYFSHTSADGTSMGDRVFPYWNGIRVGENIAASSVDRSDSFVVDLWMDSPGHCALIMNPDFTAAGIGSGHNTDNGYTYHHFWTLDFGG